MNKNVLSQYGAIDVESHDFNKTLQNLSKYTHTFSSIDFDREKKATTAEIRLKGLEDYFKMRKRWSDVLRGALFVILSFNIVLVFCVGFNWIHFDDKWFLRLILTTNLADIIGLVYVVVHFLFPPTGNPDQKETSKDKK